MTTSAISLTSKSPFLYWCGPAMPAPQLTPSGVPAKPAPVYSPFGQDLRCHAIAGFDGPLHAAWAEPRLGVLAREEDAAVEGCCDQGQHALALVADRRPGPPRATRGHESSS